MRILIQLYSCIIITKTPFSIATTPRCKGGCYSFPWISPLYPWFVPYETELSEEASSTIFKVFGMTRPGIEPRSPRPLANTNHSANVQLIGLVDRVFTNDLGNPSSIPGHVIPKTLKMVLDASLLNTQFYKVRIKGKVEQSRERSSTLPYTSV